MGKILDWAKANAKDGVNFTEIENLEKKLSLEGMTKELLKSNLDTAELKAVKSLVDSETSLRIEAHDKDKLPDLLKAKEVELEKELRGKIEKENQKDPLQVKLEEMEAKLARNELEKTLLAKKSELKSDIDIDLFMTHGTDAVKKYEEYVGKYNNNFKTALDAKIKDMYGDSTPPKAPQKNEYAMTYNDLSKLSAEEQAKFIEGGGDIIS